MKRFTLSILVVLVVGLLPCAAFADGVGALLGGIAGGLIGHGTGGRHSRDANTLVGAVGGAAVGYLIEKEIDSAIERKAQRGVAQRQAQQGYGDDAGQGGPYTSSGRVPYEYAAPGGAYTREAYHSRSADRWADEPSGQSRSSRFYHEDCDCDY